MYKNERIYYSLFFFHLKILRTIVSKILRQPEPDREIENTSRNIQNKPDPYQKYNHGLATSGRVWLKWSYTTRCTILTRITRVRVVQCLLYIYILKIPYVQWWCNFIYNKMYTYRKWFFLCNDMQSRWKTKINMEFALYFCNTFTARYLHIIKYTIVVFSKFYVLQYAVFI